MRVSENLRDNEAWFVQDDPFRGIIVQCESCGEEFNDQTHHGEPCFCHKCGKELVYRPWNSW